MHYDITFVDLREICLVIVFFVYKCNSFGGYDMLLENSGTIKNSTKKEKMEEIKIQKISHPVLQYVSLFWSDHFHCTNNHNILKEKKKGGNNL